MLSLIKNLRIVVLLLIGFACCCRLADSPAAWTRYTGLAWMALFAALYFVEDRRFMKTAKALEDGIGTIAGAAKKMGASASVDGVPIEVANELPKDGGEK